MQYRKTDIINYEMVRGTDMGKEDHKLSKAELRRKETFEVVKAGLEEEGFHMTELTMSTVAANVKAVIAALPLLVILWVVFNAVNPKAEGLSGEIMYMLLFFGIFMVLVVIHELIHGFVWGMSAKSKFKSIEFGVIWEYLTPYCTCSEPLKRHQMVLGALMPTILLGVIPAAVACCIGSVEAAFMAGAMILGGGADIMVVGKILRHKASKNALYYDHPYKVGTIVFDKEDEYIKE